MISRASSMDDSETRSRVPIWRLHPSMCGQDERFGRTVSNGPTEALNLQVEEHQPHGSRITQIRNDHRHHGSETPHPSLVA